MKHDAGCVEREKTGNPIMIQIGDKQQVRLIFGFLMLGGIIKPTNLSHTKITPLNSLIYPKLSAVEFYFSSLG